MATESAMVPKLERRLTYAETAALAAAGVALVGLAAWLWSTRDRDDDEVRRQPIDVWRETSD